MQSETITTFFTSPNVILYVLDTKTKNYFALNLSVLQSLFLDCHLF